jgi:general secretion pathway protein H
MSPDSRLIRRVRGSPSCPASPFATVSCLRSPIPHSRSPAGFSLIEILVVTVILAVAAVAVTLAVGGAGGERQLARDAERLRALIGFACEQAELSGRQIGVSIDHDGYRFSRSERADWLPEHDGELRPRKWSVNADAHLTRDGQRVDVGAAFPEKPQLVCFSSGELTAFRLELALPDSTTRYRLDGRANGDLAGSIVDARVR